MTCSHCVVVGWMRGLELYRPACDIWLRRLQILGRGPPSLSVSVFSFVRVEPRGLWSHLVVLRTKKMERMWKRQAQGLEGGQGLIHAGFLPPQGEYQWLEGCVCAQSISHVWPFWDPCGNPLGSSVLGISQIKSWSQLPFPTPRDLPNPGIEPNLQHLLRWQVDSLPLSHLETRLEG